MRAKLISVAKSAVVAMHPLPIRTENLGWGGEYIVNTPVLDADLLQSQFCICCYSRVWGKIELHQEQAFLQLSCLLRRGFPPGFAISGRGNVLVGVSYRLFPFSPESCFPAVSYSSNTALESYPFPLFCQDIGFASSTNPSLSETAEGEAVQSRPVRGGCCSGASLVHTVRFFSPKRYCI